MSNGSNMTLVPARNNDALNLFAKGLAYFLYPFVLTYRFFESVDYLDIVEYNSTVDESTGETKPTDIRIAFISKRDRILYTFSMPIIKEYSADNGPIWKLDYTSLRNRDDISFDDSCRLCGYGDSFNERINNKFPKTAPSYPKLKARNYLPSSGPRRAGPGRMIGC